MIIYNTENSMVDCFEHIEKFKVFDEGREIELHKSSKEFQSVLNKIEDLFHMGILMPAFGVSFHNETLNALKRDQWIRIDFDVEIEKNSLKFDALLFKLEETGGFNMIRLYQNQYEGRCLFFNLNEVVDLKQILK